MRIDAHHHLWRLDRGYTWLDDPAMAPIRRDFGPDDLRAELTAAGVDRTVLVEAGREDAAEVGEFLAIAEATPEIVGVVGWADIADPALAEVLAAHMARPGGARLVGVRAQVQGIADPDYLARREVQRGLSVVAAAGLTYDLVIRVDQYAAAAAAAAAVPGLPFVLDHLGKPSIRDGASGLQRWCAEIGQLAALPNVYAKLSGLVTEADWGHWSAADLRPFVLAALEQFGPDRLMFGSDWPVCRLAGASYTDVCEVLSEAIGDALGPAGQRAVYGGNATRIYGLDL